MIDTVIVLDTETDSLDPPPKGRCLEVAVALYSVKHAAVVMTYSSLIHSSNGNEAESINGIPAPLVQNGCCDAQDVWKEVADMCHGSTAILAHFAEFDMKF